MKFSFCVARKSYTNNQKLIKIKKLMINNNFLFADSETMESIMKIVFFSIGFIFSVLGRFGLQLLTSNKKKLAHTEYTFTFKSLIYGLPKFFFISQKRHQEPSCTAPATAHNTLFSFCEYYNE
jgi:hypothetical protein